MVRRKSAEPTKKEPELDNMAKEEQLTEAVSSRLHRIKRRSNVKRFLSIGLIAVVLLLAGWFTTKLAISGWNVSSDSLWKDLFSFKSAATLIGEDTGRVNFILLGAPGGSEDVDGPDLTDTIMVASLSTEDNRGLLFSLPRDLYVRIPGYGNSKLNAVYKIGNSQENAGGETISQVVGEVLGLDIPYYLKVDFNGFEQLIDELGGVTIEVEKDLYDDRYPTSNKGYEVLDIKAGTYTMDGSMALKYARSRQSTSDFDRAYRQQKLILAVREKALSQNLLSQPSKALSIIDVLNDSFKTNLSLIELKRLFDLVKDFDSTKLETKVFDDSPTGLLYGTRVDEVYVLRPVGDDYNVVVNYVDQIISGQASLDELDDKIVVEPLKIEVLNGTNITGLAGKVAAKLEAEGYDIVFVGNNATRGFVKSIVYDLIDKEREWEVRKLAASLGAEIGEDEVTSSFEAQVRIVLGSEAD